MDILAHPHRHVVLICGSLFTVLYMQYTKATIQPWMLLWLLGAIALYATYNNMPVKEAIFGVDHKTRLIHIFHENEDHIISMHDTSHIPLDKILDFILVDHAFSNALINFDKHFSHLDKSTTWGILGHTLFFFYEYSLAINMDKNHKEQIQSYVIKLQYLRKSILNRLVSLSLESESDQHILDDIIKIILSRTFNYLKILGNKFNVSVVPPFPNNDEYSLNELFI